MLQLNDIDHTLMDLSKKNLKHIKWNNNYYIKVHYTLGDTIVETRFTYETGTKAQKDYQMLIDMVQDGPTLLQEADRMKYENLDLPRWGDEKKT